MVKTCDVLYIHSTKNPTGEDCLKFSLMPMGILGILNNLKAKNIDVLGLNFAIEKTLDPQFDIPSALRGIRYRILMTDLHWYEHAYGAMYIVEESKKLYPDIPTVIGGYTSTIYAQQIMENFGGVDYIVTGDSDLPMELLVDGLLGRTGFSPEEIPNLFYRRDGAILTSKETWVQTSLDEIDFVHTDYFEHKEYVPRLGINGLNANTTGHWLCIARSCKFNCTYCCGTNANMQTLFRRCNILIRSPEEVASDFCELTGMGHNQIAYQRVVIDPLAPMREHENIQVAYNTFKAPENHICRLARDKPA